MISRDPPIPRQIHLAAPEKATAGESVKGLDVVILDSRGRPTIGNGEKVVFVAKNMASRREDSTPATAIRQVTTLTARFTRSGEYVTHARLVKDESIIARSEEKTILIEAAAPAQIAVTLDTKQQREIDAGAFAPLPVVRVQDAFGNMVPQPRGRVEMRLSSRQEKEETTRMLQFDVSDRLRQKEHSMPVTRVGVYVWDVVAMIDGKTMAARSDEFSVSPGAVAGYGVEVSDIEAGSALIIRLQPHDEFGNDVVSAGPVTLTIVNCSDLVVPLAGGGSQAIVCRGPAEDGTFRLERCEHEEEEGWEDPRLPKGTTIWTAEVEDSITVPAEVLVFAGLYEVRVEEATKRFRIRAAVPTIVHVRLPHLSSEEDHEDVQQHPTSATLGVKVALADRFGNLCVDGSATVALELYAVANPRSPNDLGANRCSFFTASSEGRKPQPYPVCADIRNGVADVSDRGLVLPAGSSSTGMYAVVAHACVWAQESINLTGVSRLVKARPGPAAQVRFVSLPEKILTAGEHWDGVIRLQVTDDFGHAVVDTESFVVLDLRRAETLTDLDVAERAAARRLSTVAPPLHGCAFSQTTDHGRVTFDEASKLAVAVPGRYVLRARLFDIGGDAYDEVARSESKPFDVHGQVDLKRTFLRTRLGATEHRAVAQTCADLETVAAENKARVRQQNHAVDRRRVAEMTYLQDAKAARRAANSILRRKNSHVVEQDDKSSVVSLRHQPTSVGSLVQQQLTQRLDALARYVCVLRHEKDAVRQRKRAVREEISSRRTRRTRRIESRPEKTNETASIPEGVRKAFDDAMVVETNWAAIDEILDEAHAVKMEIQLAREEVDDLRAVPGDHTMDAMGRLRAACEYEVGELPRRIGGLLRAYHVEAFTIPAPNPPPEQDDDGPTRQYAAEDCRATVAKLAAAVKREAMRRKWAGTWDIDTTDDVVRIIFSDAATLGVFFRAIEACLPDWHILGVVNSLLDEIDGDSSPGVDVVLGRWNLSFKVHLGLRAIDILHRDTHDHHDLALSLRTLAPSSLEGGGLLPTAVEHCEVDYI